jgi:hypothetical protein
MDLKETGAQIVDWIHMAQDRGTSGGSCDYGDEPSDSIKFWEILVWLSKYWLLMTDYGP